MNNTGTYPRLNIGEGIRVISLFAGAGGLDLGFDLTGFDVAYATDYDKTCCETIRVNLGGYLSSTTKVENIDIRKIDPATLPENIDLVVGGPPCQTFSASGRRAGGAPGRFDDRGMLFEAYCNIISHVKPKAFLFENVRGILGTNKGEDWNEIVKSFTDLGYKVNYRILDALDYGAPQQRERLIMVGHKMESDFLFPLPLFGPDSPEQRPYVTSGQALEGIHEDSENKEQLELTSGKYAHLLREVPCGDNYLYFTAKRGHPNPIFAYRSRFSDFLYKANPDTPIKTLIASPGKYTGPFHWDNRSFSIREYMRLQGFPDGYKFVGERKDIIKQIGNSVSPKLSYQLALAICKQIFLRDVDVELMPTNYALSFDTRKHKKAEKTKKLHTEVAQKAKESYSSRFIFKDYQSFVNPYTEPMTKANVTVKADGSKVKISVRADNVRKLFAKMTIEIFQSEDKTAEPEATLEVSTYGTSDHTIQTMWNAVDDWVIKSSNFHSLFELYGHFTEPHPVFRVKKFKVYSESPIAVFAEHMSIFENCSRYFPKEHLSDLFGARFGVNDFTELVKMLRSYRIDVRCYETNIAIPKDVYMVSYPFTLPFGKQMNFSLRHQQVAATTEQDYTQQIGVVYNG